MLSIICWSLALSLAINVTMFFIAFRLKSDKLTDASYAVSFIFLALFALQQSPKTTYTAVTITLVCLWALRIGGFLLYRVLRTGSDKRFDGMRDHFWHFGRFWLGQALTVWALMLPVTLALSGNSSWHILSLVGFILWVVGFAIESIADLQKYNFTHNLIHKNQWIESGIWRYSRHPNYFGEIVVWLGIYVYTLPNLTIAYGVVSFVSPLLITTLLLFVSGIPILEHSASKRWGNEPAYKTYKKRTSLLIPLPLRKDT